jgi:aminoglycoside phosphotransferase family enzyme/predicted kinase
MEAAHFIPLGESSSAESNSHKSLLSAMLDPAFYPHGPFEVTRRQTHISDLFFAGELVYKIKRSVRYSFVDYSTLARRKYFLEEELRLNRRLAPSVYLGILPISHDEHGWQLGSDAQPVEYVLVMRRLPEKRMLDYLLERGQVTPRMMAALAEILIPFHHEAARGRRKHAYGHPSSAQKIWEENLADLAPFVGRTIDAESLAAIRAFGGRFLDEHADLMLRRAREGRIRELHGDLHCEHVCFAPEGIQIFDCVEFSPKLRCIDPASEVAFLLMDLEARGAKELGREFLRRYLELAEDSELPKLLPFYQCYRALVRGKVFSLISESEAGAAARYFDLAYSATWQDAKPFMVMICGLTGSGKSSLARALGRRLGAPVINSDVVRKGIAGTSNRRNQVSYAEGIYSASMTGRAYRKMTEEAERHLAAGEGVILDATFQKAAQRSAVFEAAARRGALVAIIHCHSREGLIRERLARRAEAGNDISDGAWPVYLKQKDLFEPFAESSNYFALDTEPPVADLCGKAEQFLRAAFSNRRRQSDSYPIQQPASNLVSASR